MSVAGSSLATSSFQACRHLEHTVITLTVESRGTTIPNTAGNTSANTAGMPVATAAGRHRGPTLVPVRDGLWRVIDRTGAVLGHIERQAHTDGERYVARRIVMSTRRIELGAFWRMDDAADCFR